MKIPGQLPQFENYPTLFITSGEYEADFFLALNGVLELKEQIKMPSREEAKEKQSFVNESRGYELGATSHLERYHEDLKKKFQKKFHALTHDFLADYLNMQEIYIFAPAFVVANLEKGLSKPELKKIRMKFFKEEIKENPLEMIRRFWKTEQKAINPDPPIKDVEKKILQKPRQGKNLHKIP